VKAFVGTVGSMIGTILAFNVGHKLLNGFRCWGKVKATRGIFVAFLRARELCETNINHQYPSTKHPRNNDESTIIL